MKLKFKLFFIFITILTIFSTNKLYSKRLNYEDLYSTSTIVMDVESKSILFNKDGNKKVYPASTTKLVTAIIALEKLELDTMITASSNALYTVPDGSSSMYLRVGEVLSLKDLLYGLLLKSGNDAGNVIAEAVCKDIDSFVEEMNKKVIDIGCTNTHFSNTHGFHEDDHYTTAYDMAKIMDYCLQNEDFKTIISSREYTIKSTNKTSSDRNIISTNKMFNKNYEDMYYEYIIGGKTGYTDEAQGTFVGYLKKDDKTIIVSTFGASQDIDGNEGRFLDTIRVSNYIFDDFTKSTVINNDTFNFTLIDKENKKKYSIGLKNDITTLSDNEVYRINYRIANPVGNDFNSSNTILKLNVLAKNSDVNFNLENSYDLVIKSQEDYKYFYFNDYLDKLIIILVALLILLIIIDKLSKKNKNRNKIITRTKFKDKDLRRINR